jgi:hypothetical protein
MLIYLHFIYVCETSKLTGNNSVLRSSSIRMSNTADKKLTTWRNHESISYALLFHTLLSHDQIECHFLSCLRPKVSIFPELWMLFFSSSSRAIFSSPGSLYFTILATYTEMSGIKIVQFLDVFRGIAPRQRMIGTQSPTDTSQYPGRMETSITPLWKPKNLHEISHYVISWNVYFILFRFRYFLYILFSSTRMRNLCFRPQ